MPKIDLDSSLCSLYASKSGSCRLCQDICPTKAIEIESNRVGFIYANCTECGGCVGVCPTEAMSLNNFDSTKFFIDFLKDESESISCKKNLPCLAILSVEHLISLKIQRDFTLDLGYCSECEIKTPLFEKIETNIKEANYILNLLQKESIDTKELKYQKEEVKSDRRGFLKRFGLKGAIKTKQSFEDEVLNSETTLQMITPKSGSKTKKIVPNRRKILYTSLKDLKKPTNYHYIENISFLSNKDIESSCNNCSICYRICPSGALSSDKKNSTIFFDPLLCLNCNLCIDVCSLDSIKPIPLYTKEFFDGKSRVVAEFRVKRCNECNNLFTYTGGEQICRRCQIEEEEALRLWRIDEGD